MRALLPTIISWGASAHRLTGRAPAFLLILCLLLSSPGGLLFVALTPFPEQEEEVKTHAERQHLFETLTAAERNGDRRARSRRLTTLPRWSAAGRQASQASAALAHSARRPDLMGSGVRARC
jgi:hypothetical protein